MAFDDWIDVFWCPLDLNHRHRKGLVRDVSGTRRNACPGTLKVLTNAAVADKLGVRCRAQRRRSEGHGPPTENVKTISCADVESRKP